MRVRFASSAKYPGPISELYPALPYVPGALAANAAGLIHTRVLLFRTYGSPTTFGRSCPIAVSELSAPDPGVNGKPGWTLSRNDGRQLPTTQFIIGFAKRGVS